MHKTERYSPLRLIQESERIQSFSILGPLSTLLPPYAPDLRKTKENKKDLFPDRINPY